MVGFVGRRRELQELEDIWASPRRATVVYGRRRVGKSKLLKQFCIGRRSIYIECVQGSLADNLYVMASALTAFDGRPLAEYGYVKQALDDILEVCRAEPTVVVFDELPYLLSTADHVASSMQHFIDAVEEETRSMAVVCGSSMSVMKRETTDYDRPLYGRFHHSIHLGPMSYRECRDFHPDMPELDRLMLYLTVGGIPKYHLDTAARSYREYIVGHFLSDTADLAEEAEAVISAEFAPRDRYLAVVSAIIRGATSLKLIAEKTGLERTMCTRCLEGLEEVGIVSKVHPMMGAPKRPMYEVSDSMVAFCLTVVRAASGFSISDPDRTYDRVRADIHTFLGRRFEPFCADYVLRNRDCIEIGKWWGRSPEGETHEIDIVARVLEGDVVVSLFGECKFRTSKVGTEDLDRLRESAGLVDTDATGRLVLFSPTGFSEDLRELASLGVVELVGLDELTGR